MSVSSKHLKADNDVILDTLSKILDSVPFRSSKQCQDLLRYMVEHSLRHDNEALKERVIGCEVFGRRPDYDTAEDPIVRNRAGDVRKRLALYYRTISSHTEIELDVPSGSYRVELRPFAGPGPVQDAEGPSHGQDNSHSSKTISTPEQNAAGPHSLQVSSGSSAQTEEAANPVLAKSGGFKWSFKRRVLTLGLVVAALAGAGALPFVGNWLLHPPMSAFDSFWGPAISSSKAPIICVGSSATYRLRDESFAKLISESEMPNPKIPDREVIIKFRPGQKISADDLEPTQGIWVGIGDVTAIVSVTSMFSRIKKPYDVRFAEDVVFGDLRQSPSILIGAFNNSWTLDMDDKLPFVFYQMKYIRETVPPGRTWTTVRDANNKPTEDYALISRQMHSKMGEFSVTIAGIDMTGTRAAAEFVCDPDRMNQALKQLPSGWQGKSLQLLLHSSFINGIPSRTEVVAYHVW